MKLKALGGEAYLFGATLLAAVGWIASKLVVLEMPGPLFIGVRFFIASLILLPFCFRLIRQLSWSHCWG